MQFWKTRFRFEFSFGLLLYFGYVFLDKIWGMKGGDIEEEIDENQIYKTELASIRRITHLTKDEPQD